MSKKELINNGIQIAEKHGFKVSESLAKEIAAIENPQYRIAVAGKFQVGKSTLINKVFLGGNPILIEGEGLCTTSVNTEIEYGANRALEVFQWENADKLAETSFKKIENPTQEDLKSVTVGNDRVSLARSVSKVKLYEPNEALKNYTVIDTPGVDDPDPEILQNTTFRIIPGSDLALVVVEPRQLDQTELDLIRVSMLREGLAKMMVLVSYKPENRMTAEQRKAIIETIKAQLASCGKEDIPVEMYCFNDSIDDILCTPGQIGQTVSSFLAENAAAGREAHITAHVKAFLNDCLVDVAARIKSAAISQKEREELQKRFESKKQEVEEQCQLLISQINAEIFSVKKGSREKIKMAVTKVFGEFMQELHDVEDLEKLRNILSDADRSIKWKLAEALSLIADDIQKKVRSIFEDRLNEFKNIGASWDAFVQEEFQVDGGFLTKIPNIVWEILNVVCLDMLLPGGLILAWIIRLLQRIIPEIKNLTFQTLVKFILLKKLETALNQAEPELTRGIYEQVSMNLDEVMKTSNEFILNKYSESAQSIVAGLNTPAEDDSALEEVKKEIQTVVEAL